MKKKINIKLIYAPYNFLNKIKNFISKYWNNNHIFIKKKFFLDWQYKNGKYYNCVAVIYNSKIAGLNFFIPLSKFDQKLKKNKECFLSLVRVVNNKKILGSNLLMINKINKKFYSFIGSVGITKKSIFFHKWMKFKVGYLNHYFIFSPYLKKFSIASVKNRLKINRIVKKNNIKSIELNKYNINNLLNNNFFVNFTPTKSKNYLLNRYLLHPIYSYKAFLIINKLNKQKVILIVRIVSHNNSSIIKIIDFIGSSKNFFLINPLCYSLLKDTKSEYIDCYSYGIKLKDILRAGFTIRNKNSKIVIPNYFEPYIRTNIDIAYAFKTKNINNKEVKIFRGDGDQDRPSK